jgi:hypothetical protein
MTILSTDIKLMASERLTDNEDGGGQMSAVEIQDGVVNNLFPDISRLDRTYGRVNLRKLYLAVRTANRDIYYGSHAIVTDPPDDPRVSVVLFTTGSYTDERTNARDRIESYVVVGPVTRYTLLGDQVVGQRLLRLYAMPEAELPKIGDVYALSEEDDAGNPTAEIQYVRITEVSGELQQFEDGKGVFTRKIITVGISDALRRSFEGAEAVLRETTAKSSPTRFRETTVADASRYFGIVQLDQPAQPGDMNIKTKTIFGQLVPSATAESPVADLTAGHNNANLVASGAPYSVTTTVTGGRCAFGRPVMPGSVSISNLTDDKLGTLRDGGGADRGQIDYNTGLLSGMSLSGTQTITATPATAVAEPSMTASVPISLGNRGYNYVQTLFPIPSPGTLVVDYMAEGNWYRMYDDGTGQLQDEHGGTANVNFVTGTVVATLGGLPDVDSSVIFSWATPAHYEERTADPDVQLPYMAVTVGAQEILPGSLTLSWEAGGVTKTATDNGTGDLTGDAEGRVIYGLGEIGFRPLLVPASGATLTIEYQKGVTQIETFTSSEYTRDSDSAVFLLPGAPIRPGTLHIEFPQSTTMTVVETSKLGPNAATTQKEELGTETVQYYDISDGTLIDGSFNEAGTINYTTGEVNITIADSSVDVTMGGSRTTTIDSDISGPITTRYQLDSVIPDDMTETAELPDARIDLLPTIRRFIVPGSVEFQWGGETYIDREGTLYNQWNRETGAATMAGSIDYSTGIVSLYGYAGGHSNTLQIRTLLARYEQSPTVAGVYFRTPGAPLRPSSIYVRAVRPDGNVISATASLTGTIDTDTMEGSVNYETGIMDLQFREYLTEAEVPAALMALPGWAEDALVAEGPHAGKYRVAIAVDASTIKYNAVVYTQMPLSADVLGLDPVRLPMDGRVPIIRSGDVVVVHSTQTDTLPNPVSAGQTITLSRDQLASVVLEDSEGTKLDAALYTINRETGTVTMADPLDLSAYTQPLIARHRVEDMALVNEAQINGQISLVGGISRAYDPADTWVSSALIFGDLGSRVHHQFSQATWTNVWSDERIGNPTTAQYNDLLYPIQVDNKNSIRERWALIFTSSTIFNIVGEVSGIIGTGNTSTDCTPINPTTGEPYFIVLSAGWGSGWATNNVLRFNTDAAHAPIWVARTTISGAATHNDDSFKIEARGDAD